MAYEIHEIAEITKNIFDSKIREYAGPRTVNCELVRVYCIYIIYVDVSTFVEWNYVNNNINNNIIIINYDINNNK